MKPIYSDPEPVELPPFRAGMVTVRRVYEVYCEYPTCNGNFDSEFHQDRDDAAEARSIHIDQHRHDEAVFADRRGAAR
jgi:hypothetical protein